MRSPRRTSVRELSGVDSDLEKRRQRVIDEFKRPTRPGTTRPLDSRQPSMERTASRADQAAAWTLLQSSNDV